MSLCLFNYSNGVNMFFLSYLCSPVSARCVFCIIALWCCESPFPADGLCSRWLRGRNAAAAIQGIFLCGSFLTHFLSLPLHNGAVKTKEGLL